MKKLILLVAMAVVALAGCQKSELVDPIESNDVFTASVEEFDAQTKTSINENRRIVWSTGDRLAIFQGNTIADEYQLADGSAGLSSGSFKWVSKDNEVNSDFGAGFELPCNVAFYPYAEGLLLDGDMLEDGKEVYTVSTVVLPVVQTYVQNSFGNGAFPMVAVTQNMEDHNLKFKNVLGAMELQLKGTQLVKSIKVEGSNGEKLSGGATVTAYANNLTPAIKMASDASTYVMLDCVDGVQLNEAEATNFYIALPPVLFEKGFTVTVTDVEENVQTITAEAANTVLRSSILVMPEITIESEDVENPEGGSGDSGNGYDYVDEFGVNHGPGVAIGMAVWAPVNCGYEAATADYKGYPYGKLYQWGRRYGQGYDSNDASTPELSEGGVSLQGGQSKSNENVFFTCSDYPYDWLYSQDGTLWNSGSEESPVKTEYDPCPEGWRVPTYAELNELYTNRSSWTKNDLGQSGYWFSGPSSYSQEAAQVFFPAAGYRGYSYGSAYARGILGYYWSSSPNDDYLAYLLSFYNGDAYMLSYYRADGDSVRCVQE